MANSTMDTQQTLNEVVEAVGVDEVIEQIAMVCREQSDFHDDEGDVEESRKWRVRGNGVMQALRFYQAFVKERDA